MIIVKDGMSSIGKKLDTMVISTYTTDGSIVDRFLSLRDGIGVRENILTGYRISLSIRYTTVTSLFVSIRNVLTGTVVVYRHVLDRNDYGGVGYVPIMERGLVKTELVEFLDDYCEGWDE